METTGYFGTFVVDWSNTWIDGQRNAPDAMLEPGASWAWLGPPVRLDGPNSILPLGPVGGSVQSRGLLTPNPFPEDDILRGSFIVTDGLKTYAIAQIDKRPGQPLLLFQGETPPQDKRLWVIDRTYPDPAPKSGRAGVDVSALIDTPEGPKPAGTLRPGDLVHTLHGAQPIVWVGEHQIGAAQMHLTPSARPLRAQSDLLLAPDQGIVLHDPSLRAIFGEAQAIVSAADLPDQFGLYPDLTVEQAQLCQIFVPKHSALRIGPHWVESFLPEQSQLDRLGAGQRAALLKAASAAGINLASVQSGFRRLTHAEAAISLHRAGQTAFVHKA